MKTEHVEQDEWFKRWWKLAGDDVTKAKRRTHFQTPVTPVGKWQRSYAKVRCVKSAERGSGAQAVRAHVRYLTHKDGHDHEDRLVREIRDLSIVRDWQKVEQHYRVIVAPERGDVLDMKRMAENICREVEARFMCTFHYAGVVHEKMQSNGRMNKHLHLIFKDTLGKGANALKGAFSTAAAKEATLQFEEKGLHYIPDPLDMTYQIEAKKLEKELYDYSIK